MKEDLKRKLGINLTIHTLISEFFLHCTTVNLALHPKQITFLTIAKKTSFVMYSKLLFALK